MSRCARRLAAALAGEFQAGARPRQGEDARVDKGVVDDDVGRREPVEGVQGESPGSPGPAPTSQTVPGSEARA